MDLIYMNSNKEDIGVLKDYTFDLEFGSDQNNFECTVNSNNHVCEAGYYLYYEGAEYGGIIDSINIDTESKTVKYIGRTWHGIIESKTLQPDIGADYLTVSGEANTVIASLVSRMGIGALFKVSTKASGINISSYKMNRYVGGYTGIMKMLKKSNAKLDVAFKKGFVELSTSPLTDYSQDEQFDTDQISFTIQKNYKPINHVICLGQGDLKDRRVIHVFADALGNISGTQTLTGIDEVCATYDNSNAESDDELKQGGFDMIAEAWASDSIDFNFTSNAESFDINDVIGAKELTTDTIVTASITKKIVKIVNNTTTISYACEGNSGTISSGSYPSSGSGGSSGGITKEEVIDLIYPVGSIYMGINNINPSTFLSGTWEEWGSGRVPVGVNTNDTNFNSVEKTGGESSHTLSEAEMPQHKHDVSVTSSGTCTITSSGSHTHTVPNHTHTITSSGSCTITSSGSHTHSTTAKDTGTTGKASSSSSSTALYISDANLYWVDLKSKGHASATTNLGTVSGYYSGNANNRGIAMKIPALSIASSGGHTHTVPNHTHTVSSSGTCSITSSGSHTHTVPNHTHTISESNKGSGDAHNNLQPYITCYMWKRTA